MRSTTRWKNSAAASLLLAPVLLILPVAGCCRIPNQFRETGPAVMANYNTPTAEEVKERAAPVPTAPRDDWPPLTLAAQNGIVTHWPLYFQDPFVAKGAGRTECTCPRNVYRLGWQDFVATPYGLGRYLVNWMFLPASMVVTPPWTVMASDGKLSRQCLGCDHDATTLCRQVAELPPVYGELVPMETLEPAPQWKSYCVPPTEPPPCEPEPLGD